ncbi:MAG: DUF4416 family protein [Desulfobacteraceae bacterium]|nr:DUF4416 family protein [Desulfobacteraceae bacterium]MCF8095371.1 DUF4416 family protein [Desulfobacteraceae bacterium]
MSQPASAEPAKLVIGVFTAEPELIMPVAGQLSEKFGNIDLESDWFPFDYTDYYEPEMGSGLMRRMMAFKPLIAQDALAGIKHVTNEIESDFTAEEKRRINIDPGYLLRERFVLATAKNFSHRIYIGRGIYADLTLVYRKGAFRTLPWTYPDYAAQNMLEFLQRVRSKYVYDLKSLKEHSHD